MEKLKGRELRQSYQGGYDRLDSYGSYDSYGGYSSYGGGCCHHYGCHGQHGDGGLLLPLVVASIAGAVGFAAGFLANIVIMGRRKRSLDPSVPIAQKIMQGTLLKKSFFN